MIPLPIRFTLPLPPSVNAGYVEKRWTDRQSGKEKRKRIPTPELAAFKELAPWKLYQQGITKGSWSKVEAFGWDGKFYLPRTNCDADNYIKFWQDAVAEWIGVNDKRAMEFRVQKRVDSVHPRVEIYLYPLAPKEAQVAV